MNIFVIASTISGILLIVSMLQMIFARDRFDRGPWIGFFVCFALAFSLSNIELALLILRNANA